MKTLSITLFFIFFLTACTTSHRTLLSKPVYYTKTVNVPYAELGECLKKKFGLRTNGNAVGYSYINGALVPIPYSTSIGYDYKLDEPNETYYITDYNKNGNFNVKTWIMVIKGVGKNKSNIEIHSRKSITGHVRFSSEFMDDKIKTCL